MPESHMAVMSIQASKRWRCGLGKESAAAGWGSAGGLMTVFVRLRGVWKEDNRRMGLCRKKKNQTTAGGPIEGRHEPTANPSSFRAAKNRFRTLGPLMALEFGWT